MYSQGLALVKSAAFIPLPDKVRGARPEMVAQRVGVRKTGRITRAARSRLRLLQQLVAIALAALP
jgi:hypothetical protein